MVRKKRCLLAITGAFALDGGIAVANRLAIYALSSAGYQIDLIAFNEIGASKKAYEVFTNITYQTARLSKPRFALLIWQRLISRRYDLVFCDHVNLASLIAPLAMIGVTQYMVRLNGIEVFSPKPDVQGMLGLHWAARRLAISEYTKQQVLRSFPSLDVRTVELGLDPERTKRLSESVPMRSGTHVVELTALDGNRYRLEGSVVLHVGRMASGEQYKGQDVLIEAMPQILAQHEKAQLVLVGHGDDMPRLMMLVHAQSPTVQSRIFMPGFVSDNQLEQLYQSCALFAMPSRGEGFGFVYIEAMCWGKPCIASHMDAAQYIVQHERTGLLVEDATNPALVAEAVLMLLNNPNLAAQYGQASFEEVKAKYTFEQFCNRFLPAVQALSL